MKQSIFVILMMWSLAASAEAQVMPPSEYVNAAGAGDLFEKQSSQTVLETNAAERDGIAVKPPSLTPLQRELLGELRAEKGTARDATYLAQQKAAHGQALNVQQAYAKEGTATHLKAAAASIAPVVQHHIAMLKKM
jgi:putative membrane protein